MSIVLTQKAPLPVIVRTLDSESNPKPFDDPVSGEISLATPHESDQLFAYIDRNELPSTIGRQWQIACISRPPLHG
jgi:hypothetical protein